MTRCVEFLSSIHRCLDGELGAAERSALEAHLAGCADCREEFESLGAVQGALRVLPQATMPASALDEVWSRTVRTVRAASSLPRHRVWWLAAAAALTAALLVPTLVSNRRSARERHDLAVARAGDEARLVFSLTAQALQRTERIARDQVLGDQVAPALRKIPIRWTEATSPDPRRNDL